MESYLSIQPGDVFKSKDGNFTYTVLEVNFIGTKEPVFTVKSSSGNLIHPTPVFFDKLIKIGGNMNDKKNETVQVGDVWEGKIFKLEVLKLTESKVFCYNIEHDSVDECYLVDFLQGCKLVERNGKPVAPETLEDRIKAQFGKYRVETFEDGAGNYLYLQNKFSTHVHAQSIKGFAYYVYDLGTRFSKSINAVRSYRGKTIQPVAVLFYKENGGSND